MARAKALGALFVDNLSESQINYSYEVLDSIDPIESPFVAATMNVIAPHIVDPKVRDSFLLYFPYNSTHATFDEETKNILAEMAHFLQKNDASLKITGHTCDLGDNNSNYYLGLWRAEQVRDYLVDLGVDPGSLNLKSMGEIDPLVPNIHSENRKKNRRTELVIVH